MISLKTLILVIVASALIGAITFYFTEPTQFNNVVNITKPIQNNATSSTAAPKPTLPPLDSTSDLNTETIKTSPEDFSSDFQDLKNNLNHILN